MAKRSFVLDTSAIIAFLENEDGAERVEYVLKNEDVIVCNVSLLEVFYIFHREQSRSVAEQHYALLKSLPVSFVWTFDEPLILTAGRFKATTPLSIVDALIAACAYNSKATLLHKDPEYQKLQGAILLETLPFKNPSDEQK